MECLLGNTFPPGGVAGYSPASPPTTNMAPSREILSLGPRMSGSLRHIVPIQLNTLTAEGTAMIRVDTMNDEPSVGFIPLTNMWWPHTIQPRNPIATIANTIEW